MKQSFHNSVWAIRDARIVLPARALSSAGTSLTTVMALLLLHDGGAGAFGIAAFLAVMAVPTIATIGIAGRVADTADSRVVLTVTAAAQAAALAALGFAPSLPVIFVTGFVIALAQAFAQPAWQALVPRVVGDERIGQAVAWQQGLGAIAGPAGAALGGVLVTVGQVRWGFWADAATSAVLFFAALAVRTRRGGDAVASAAASDTPPARPAWTDGVRIVTRDRVVWPLFVAILLFVVLVEGINSVEVFLARDELHATAWQYGLAELFAGAGTMIGAVLAGRIAAEGARAAAAVAGFGLAALSLVAAGLAPGFWFYAVVITALSATFGLGNATFGALLTTRTAEAHRGRVFAAMGALARLASLTALVLGGIANATLGPRATFVIAGAAGALVMLVAGMRVRAARRAAASAPREAAEAGLSGW